MCLLRCLIFKAVDIHYAAATGLLWLIQISTPASSPFQTSSASKINWTVPYFSVAVALNVFVTLMIAVRLWLYRYKMTSLLGSSHGSHYIGIAAMVVESAAIYSTFALLFIIPFGVGSPIANTFLQVLSQVQVSIARLCDPAYYPYEVAQIIAPLLIIYRVARGKGWTSSTSTAVMSGKTHSTAFSTSTRNTANVKNISNFFPKAGSSSYVSKAASDVKGGNIEMDTMDAATLRESRRAVVVSDGESRIGEAV